MIGNNESRRIYLDGIDITNYVIDLPTTPLLKPEWGSIPDLPTLQIRVHSTDYAFHYLHPVSILYQKPLDKMKLEIKNFGNATWRGTVESVSVDYQSKQATITGVSALSKKINFNARIDANPQTPAEAAKQILVLHNIPYDQVSFARAEQLLNDIPVSIQVRPSVLEWQGTLGDILKLLAVVGIGRFFLTSTGKIGFDSFEIDQTPTISYTLTDDNIYDQISIESDEQEGFEGYSVSWLYSQAPETDGPQSGRLQSIDFSSNCAVNLLTQGGAIYVGTQWVACSRRKFKRVVLSVPKNYGLITTMSSFIALNSYFLGVTRLCEVIGIDDSDNRFTKLTLRIDYNVE